MSKFGKWMKALLLLLALVVMSCDTPTSPGKDKKPAPIGELEFVLYNPDYLTSNHTIVVKLNGETLSDPTPDNPRVFMATLNLDVGEYELDIFMQWLQVDGYRSTSLVETFTMSKGDRWTVERVFTNDEHVIILTLEV